MLSVLAGVATQEPARPGPAGEEPFDRERFLAKFQQPASTLDSDPYGGVAVLEEGLNELYKSESFNSQPGDDVVQSRVDHPRLDNAPQYDVVASGILAENELHNLMEVYWARIQPVGRALDPSIHTNAYLRSQSALLTTTVLWIASQSLPVSGHVNSLVARLEAHIETLLAVINKQGLQSIEICLAHTMLCLFIGSHQLDRTWGFTSKAIAMAVELRLDVSPPPSWALAPSPHHSATTVALTRNVQRLWFRLIDWDRGCAFIRGRRPLLRDPAHMDPAFLLDWCRQPEALSSDPAAVGCCLFLDVVLQLQLMAARQLVQQDQNFNFDTYRATVDRALDAWRDTWIPLFTEQDRHRSLFDMDGMRLVLLMMPYEYDLIHHRVPTVSDSCSEVCITSALTILTRALPIISGTDPVLKVGSLYTYRYYRTAYAGLTALRMINTAPRTRDADVYLLSIVAAVARRLIDLRLHSNITSITNLLGRPLLRAARKLAAARLHTGNGGSRPAEGTESAVSGAMSTDPLSLDLVGGGEDGQQLLDAMGQYPGWSLATLLFPGLSEGVFDMLDPLGLGGKSSSMDVREMARPTSLLAVRCAPGSY